MPRIKVTNNRRKKIESQVFEQNLICFFPQCVRSVGWLRRVARDNFSQSKVHFKDSRSASVFKNLQTCEVVFLCAFFVLFCFFKIQEKKKIGRIQQDYCFFYRIMFVSNKAVIHQYQRHYSILLQTYNDTSEPKSVKNLLH